MMQLLRRYDDKDLAVIADFMDTVASSAWPVESRP
jgi:hypothetical protein